MKQKDVQTARCFLATVLIGLVIYTPIIAQSQIMSIMPAPNSTFAEVNEPIEIVFTYEIDETSLTQNTVQVWGSIAGHYRIYTTVSGSRLLINHTMPFVNGERVRVSITDDLRDLNGKIIGGFGFSFTVRNEFGTGKFIDSTSFHSGKDPVSLLLFDYNMDLLPDMISTNFSASTITLFHNEKQGGKNRFRSTFSIPVGMGPIHADAGDFDNDLKNDLVVANILDNSITLLKNSSLETEPRFIQFGKLNVNEKPIKVRLHDMDLDGDLDLLVLSFGRDRLQVFRNDGNGQFALSVTLNTPASPTDFVVEDWNADGYPDIAVASSAEPVIALWEGTGPAAFNPQQTINVGIPVHQILIQDIFRDDTDGSAEIMPELLVMSQSEGTVKIFRSSDGSLWNQMVQQFTIFRRPMGMALADIDKKEAPGESEYDYDLDLLVTSFDESVVYMFRNINRERFEDSAQIVKLHSNAPTVVATGDLDRDGDQDIALAETQSGRIKVWWNLGGAGVPRGFRAIIDFDSVMVTTSKTLQWKLENPSVLPFTLHFLLPENSSFSAPDSIVIDAFSETLVPLTFAPQDTGVRRTTMTVIATNVAQTGSFDVTLKGIGVRPIFSVNPDTLYFQSVPPGQSKRRYAVIYNSGNTHGELTLQTILPNRGFVYKGNPSFKIRYTSSTPVFFEFMPDTIGTYFSKVTFLTNDPIVPELTLYLAGKGSTFKPQITSADTLYATEDIEAIYEVQATDPDGDSLEVSYFGLPDWLEPSPDNTWVLRGTPKEGDGNTSFLIRVSDGFLEDELQVKVIVTPVNDPPILTIEPNRTVISIEEKDQVAFELIARDPEDSTMVISADMLPPGARLEPVARNRARFSWMPDFGQAGEYRITFTAQELYENPPLKANLSVRIVVNPRLPDLIAVDFAADSSFTFKNRPFPVRVTFRNENAPVLKPFRIIIQHNGALIAETTIAGMELNAEQIWSPVLTFSEIGSRILKVIVDADQVIKEKIESNNSLQFSIEVRQGRLYVSPNPFTPNNDGYNDRVRFDFREFSVSNPGIKIWNFQGKLVRQLTTRDGTSFYWNGLDTNGNPQRPGIYLFQFYDGKTLLANGHIVLAR